MDSAVRPGRFWSATTLALALVLTSQNVAQAVAVVKAASLTPAYRTALVAAVTRFIDRGTSDAANNFASLRGKATYQSATDQMFRCTLSLAPLSRCKINGLLDPADGYNNWSLQADTVQIAGPPRASLAFVQATIARALPNGFTPTTDPKLLDTDELRWDDRTAKVAVSVGTWADKTGVSYIITMLHFP